MGKGAGGERGRGLIDGVIAAVKQAGTASFFFFFSPPPPICSSGLLIERGGLEERGG